MRALGDREFRSWIDSTIGWRSIIRQMQRNESALFGFLRIAVMSNATLGIWRGAEEKLVFWTVRGWCGHSSWIRNCTMVGTVRLSVVQMVGGNMWVTRNVLRMYWRCFDWDWRRSSVLGWINWRFEVMTEARLIGCCLWITWRRRWWKLWTILRDVTKEWVSVLGGGRLVTTLLLIPQLILLMVETLQNCRLR